LTMKQRILQYIPRGCTYDNIIDIAHRMKDWSD
jgi:hypothetical protein